MSVSAEVSKQAEPEAELTLRDTGLWFPDIPHPSLKLLGVPKIQDGPEGLPLSVAIFGGLRGQDLEYVINVAVVLDYYSESPLAVQVTYSDRRPAVCFGVFDPDYFGGFDPNGWIEPLNFAVDGPGGERITSVETVYSKRQAFYGFRVRRSRSLVTWAAEVTGRIFLACRSQQIVAGWRNFHRCRYTMLLLMART